MVYLVNDIIFYITLGVAIVLAVVLIYILYMIKKQTSSGMMKILTTFHAELFGYETALVEFIGSRGYKSHVFPEIIKSLDTLKDDSLGIKNVFEAKTPLEAMQKWINVLNNALIVKNASITLNDNNEYIIKTGHCSLSNPTHKILGERKGICPLALTIVSASNIADDTKEPEISYSEFLEHGSVTVIKLKDKQSE